MADIQRTVILIKPDAMQRDLLGEIIRRFERKGLKIIGLKFIQLTDTLLEEHYSHHKDKPFFRSLKEYMQSSPVILMVLSGINAVSATRLIVGPTRGYEADAGSIRGDLSLNAQSNLVHASESPEAGETEVKRFFSEDELFDYEKSDFRYIYADESF